MTCREMLEMTHSDLDASVVEVDACPMEFMGVGAPDYCKIAYDEESCKACWDRELVDEIEETPKKIQTSSVYGVMLNNDFEPHIKDSGDRTEFSTGACRDMHAGKGRMDLLPWAAIMEVSKHCENGAVKYGEHNVDKGIPTSSLCDSAARHLAKYLDGWTDEPHLLASAWNLLWVIQMEIKNKDMVNTPWKKKDAITDTPRE